LVTRTTPTASASALTSSSAPPEPVTGRTCVLLAPLVVVGPAGSVFWLTVLGVVDPGVVGVVGVVVSALVGGVVVGGVWPQSSWVVT
jgi:hypothetical protein